MPEKAAAENVKTILIVHGCIKALMTVAFFGILIVWAIDGLKYVKFQDMKKFDGIENVLPSFENVYFADASFEHPSDIGLGGLAGTQVVVPWILSNLEANYSSSIVDKWLNVRNRPCKNSTTVDIRALGLDGNRTIELSAGDIHEFVFQAVDDSGAPVCSGGDYFELDLSGERWKARPPVKDMANGTYTFSLQVHPDFTGVYNLTIILLFRQWEGLNSSPEELAVDKVLRVTPIKVHKLKSMLPEIAQCRQSDYSKDVWSGRWTRHARNDSCPISDDGRYRCQEASFPCQHPWCDGALGALESNGWVYSTHCSFKMFSMEEAWDSLNNRWIFWWGDSNHCDTIRNILSFILGVSDMNIVPRMFDRTIANPKNPFQMVRFTSVFNGHPNFTGNYQGLNSLASAKYRKLVKGFFSGNVVPDTVIMNSGLHDGFYWWNIQRYIKGADYAAAFWADVMEGIKKRGLRKPDIIYRTTVATAGPARKLGYNPQKVEAFNGVLLDKLRQYKVLDKVVDNFDMTFPWHYSNRYNDGIHYGRAPWKAPWKDGKIGHQYFVDLMLCHVLLNAICIM